MVPHIKSVARTCYSYPLQTAHIRPFLTHHAIAILTNAHITSRLDNVNSFFVGLLKCSTRKLELVQNIVRKEEE